MAKMVFQKGNKTELGLVKAGIDDAQIQTDIPANNYSAYDILTVSDSIYNNIYKGKKWFSISEDTVNEVDNPTTAQVSQTDFEKHIENYVAALKEFKERFPSHPKMTEIDACISFIEAIDTSSLTYPHNELKAYCAASDKWVELGLI